MITQNIRTISEVEIKLNQFLLDRFGLNVSLHKITKQEGNMCTILLNFSKIFSVIDEHTKTVYLRSIYFKDIHSFDYKIGSEIKIDHKEIKNSIKSEFNRLRNEISDSILHNKPLLLKLINNAPSFSHFFGKLIFLTTQLIDNDKIPKYKIEQYIEMSPKYDKYVQLLIDMNFATYNDNKDLVTTENTKKILKDNGNKQNVIGETVNEILYLVIRDNLDYITNILKLPVIRSLVNIASCLHFIKQYLKLDGVIEISVDKIYRIYYSLIGRTSPNKIDKLLTYLTYAGTIRINQSTRNIQLVDWV